jgi:murein DD-endopeptidase MepM/ murein hydrolase activator NlpD
MKVWPVPDSFSRVIPMDNAQGSFWENRQDRNHAGVDIYAPSGSVVLATEDGFILETCIFTSPDVIRYWNITYSILLKTPDNRILRFAEMGDITVKQGQKVVAGDLLGHVGIVLNTDKIDETSPGYIQKLKVANLPAMLHFEMYSSLPIEVQNYLGGNFFKGQRPVSLINPTEYLKSILQDS